MVKGETAWGLPFFLPKWGDRWPPCGVDLIGSRGHLYVYV